MCGMVTRAVHVFEAVMASVGPAMTGIAVGGFSGVAVGRGLPERVELPGERLASAVPGSWPPRPPLGQHDSAPERQKGDHDADASRPGQPRPDRRGVLRRTQSQGRLPGRRPSLPPPRGHRAACGHVVRAATSRPARRFSHRLATFKDGAGHARRWLVGWASATAPADCTHAPLSAPLGKADMKHAQLRRPATGPDPSLYVGYSDAIQELCRRTGAQATSSPSERRALSVACRFWTPSVSQRRGQDVLNPG